MADYVTNTADYVVAGAGVIGLAIARSLAIRGMDVLILERARAIGTETSSRNSEVIHAGIYYPPDSLKSRLCIEGRDLLYEYCAVHGVGYSKLGKLIVATRNDEIQRLDDYLEIALTTRVQLESLSDTDARKLEPDIECVAALMSPMSGIIDVHELMLSLLADIEAANGIVVCNTNVTVVRNSKQGVVVSIDENGEDEIVCREFVNATGLHAQDLARRIPDIDESTIPVERYAIGHYYSLSGRSPFKHLIYPVAGDGGLGVHVTLDLAGRAKFGPDVRWIDRLDYAFDDSRRIDFVSDISRYYPEIIKCNIVPGYTGIRPKIAGPGELPADFVISGPESHGLPGITNLYGIESPGLTACLAIGDYVADRVT